MSVTLKINGNPDKGNEKGNELGILETCIAVDARAKALSPVDSGLLRASITYRTTLGSGNAPLSVSPEPGIGYVGTNVNYAIYQEFGTKRMPAQPFLRPAGLIVQQPSFVNEIIKLFNTGMGEELPKAK